MKKSKGSGKAIIATARKIAVVIWNMLTGDAEFDIGLMVDSKLAKKAESMSGAAGGVEQAVNEAQEKPAINKEEKKSEVVKKVAKKIVKISGVAREKRKKLAKGYFGG